MSYNVLAVGICWYDDPGVYRLLDSLPEEIPKIIVDGKFRLYNSEYELSDFRDRYRVTQYPNVKLIDAPNLLEHEKRTRYLEAMYDYRYGLMLDSDEYIIDADWDVFLENCSRYDEGIHHVRFNVDGHGRTYPRLWVRPSDWQYYKCHNIFRNKNGQTIISPPLGNVIEGITCGMDDSQRDECYVSKVYEYQKKLIESEKGIRNTFRATGRI